MSRRLKTIEADLDSADADVVARAIEELACAKHAAAMEMLLKKSGDDSFSAVKLAADAFVKSVSARPKVALRHSSSAVREAAINELGRAKVAQAVPELARILRSRASLEMRCLSAGALGSIGHSSCVAILVEARQNPEVRLRAAALHGLQNVLQVAGEQEVIGFLEDDDWSLRLDAKEHLESTGWIPQTPHEKVLWGIALGRFDEAVSYGQVSIGALLEATLRVNDAEVRRWSALALSRLLSDHVKTRLRQALQSRDDSERKAAADALSILGIPFDAVGASKSREPETESASVIRDSIFAAAARMLTLIGQP